MAGSTEMLAAFRELTTAKQLERSDLLELLRDGIQAALVRKFGPNVKFELSVDELQGTIKVVRLRQVVETVNSQLAGQFHIQTNHAQSFWGLCARLYTKLTAHTLSVHLNRLLGSTDVLRIKALAFPQPI